MWEGILEDTVPGKTEKTRKNDFILSTLGNFLKKKFAPDSVKIINRKKITHCVYFYGKIEIFRMFEKLESETENEKYLIK